MKLWTDDKLSKEISKGRARKWIHLPALEAELAARQHAAATVIAAHDSGAKPAGGK